MSTRAPRFPKRLFLFLHLLILLLLAAAAQAQHRRDYFQYDAQRYEAEFADVADDLVGRTLGNEYGAIYVPDVVVSNPSHQQKLFLAIKVLNQMMPLEFDKVDGGRINHSGRYAVGKGVLPKNTFPVEGALSLVAFNLKLNLFAQGESYTKANELAEVFMKTFSLRGAGKDGFSGLIFFDDFVQNFSKQENIDRALSLSAKLDFILNDLLTNKSKSKFSQGKENFYRNLMEVAQEIYPDPVQAIKNLGLLMSRDVGVDQYFSYIEGSNGWSLDLDTILNIKAIPVKVRAISEALQLLGNTDHDEFSFAGGFKTKDYKSYYYWSGAYFGVRLLEQGFTEKQALIAQETMIRTYKYLRYARGYSPMALPNAIFQFSSPVAAGILAAGVTIEPTALVSPGEVLQYWATVHSTLTAAWVVSGFNFARPKYLKDDLKSILEMGDHGVLLGSEISCDKIARGVHF